MSRIFSSADQLIGGTPLLELTHDYHVTHAWTQHHRYRYGMYDDRGWHGRPGKGKQKADPNHDFEDEFALHGNEAFLRNMST